MSSLRPHILFADDEATSRLLMCAALEKSGFSASLAVDGDDALRQFRARPFDMVLLDVDMPGLDGFQVCAALRAGIGDELPIVMVTGMHDEESIERAYQVGATDFIAKPINWSLIGHRLKYVLRAGQALLELRAGNARNAAILNAIPDLMFEVDLEGRFLGYHSPRSELLATPPEAFLGRTASEILPPEAAAVCLAALREAHEKGSSTGRQYQLNLGQGRQWFELSVSRKTADPPQAPNFIALSRDITERKQAERYEQFRNRTLELLVGGATLAAILDAIVRGVERLDPAMLCSVLLLDGDGRHLRHTAAPSLPEFYNAFVNGMAIAPDAGSCGAAAFSGERVVVADIATHPFWTSFREVAARAGLGACWSQPIRSSAGRVLGTFAIYHRQAHTPAPADFQIIEQAARLASLAIEKRQAEEELHLAASVFTHAREGIMITDVDATIIDVNEAFTRITGYSRDEVLGRNPRLLNSGRHPPQFYAAMWRDLLGKGHWQGETWNRRKSGELYAEMKTISAVRDAQGQTRQYVSLFSDITLVKEHEKQLEHLAHYDALTTLPNRVLLADRMRQALAQAQRRRQSLAVAYLDLDGFKAINDRHGHEVGDQLLMGLAAHMKKALREGDTLARLGGDEFVAVLFDLADVPASGPLLSRLLTAAAQPVHLGDLVLQVSASLGVTFYPQAEEVDADQLLRQADQAMYQAKLSGRNRCHVFDAQQDNSLRDRHESLERIRRALIEGEFLLHYQPKVNMRSGAVIGAEALIRWQHPQDGLQWPARFLPVIEDHPLAIEVGEWVIDTALRQIELWSEAGLDIPISVNIGARQLQQADFVDRLRALLRLHPRVRPGALELEVLETSALEDLAGAAQVIESCRAIGVACALDDFGTGYSSLSYLKRLPVSLLKIDQSFVRDMLDDPDDLAILEGVLGLARAFRRRVIAEGVEAVAQGEMLLNLGCELAQGYAIARPMAADALPGWAAAWRPAAAWLDRPPVERGDLPLLFARVEHDTWITGLEARLRGEGAGLPVAHRECRYAGWLEFEGRQRHGAEPAFRDLESLHRELHGLAAELCELHGAGRKAEALARLGELHGLRAALHGHVRTLLREPRA